MTRQITIAAPPPAPVASQEKASISPLRLRINAAIAVGTGELILISAVGTWVAAWLAGGTPPRAAIGWIVLGAASVGLCHGAALVIVWSSTVAAREWKVDDLERAYRMNVEDEERAHKMALEGAIDPGALPAAPPDFAYLPGLAFALLDRHFAGLSTSRDDCLAESVCDQAQWNAANLSFIAARQKHGYTMRPGPDLGTAWTTWRQRVSVRDGEVWVRYGNGERMILGRP